MSIQQITDFLKRQAELNVKRRILPSPTVDVANGGGGYELYAKVQSGVDAAVSSCNFLFTISSDYASGTMVGSVDNIVNSVVGQFILDSDLTVSGLSGDQNIGLHFWPTGNPPTYRTWTWELVAYPSDQSEGSESDPCHHYVTIANIEYTGSDSTPTVTQIACDQIWLNLTEVSDVITEIYWDDTCNALRYRLGKGVKIIACEDSTSESSCTNVIAYGSVCLDESV